MPKVLYWFRDDLRLQHNEALGEAAKQGSILPVYILAQGASSQRPGAAGRSWLHKSLASLEQSIKDVGGHLYLDFHAERVNRILQLAQEFQCTTIVTRAVFDPTGVQEQVALCQFASQVGIKVQISEADTLFDLRNLKTYQVFTPFWNVLRHAQTPQLSAELNLQGAFEKQQGLELSQLALTPTVAWDAGFWKIFSPGEQGAQERWKNFGNNHLLNYAQTRDFPAQNTTSRLSPHLRFGEISVRQLWFEAMQINPESAWPFLRQLAWRDFSRQLLVAHPQLIQQPLRLKFNAYPWTENQEYLYAWQRGQTGIPLVDAGMRELWHTGTMHNRVRMLVSSYLTKNLGVHWKAGARWFHQTLLDGEVANNIFGWQWSAGCGADAAPFFRIFNPLTQGAKFDAQGEYVKGSRSAIP